VVRLLVALLACVVVGPGAAGAQEFWLPAPLDSLIARARADSNDPQLHHMVALAYLNRERYAEAEATFREILAIDPR
jgi:Tfp pilus assembly protein PilF